jgi:hypothetical protein
VSKALHVKGLGSRGQVQEEELDSCRAAGERGPVAKRDEGPGETEGVSPGAFVRRVGTKIGPGRIRGQN